MARSRLCILSVLSVLVLVAPLTGCSSDEDDAGEPDEQHESSQDDEDTGEDDGEDASDVNGDAQGPDCDTRAEQPAGLLLTWQRDPTSTMTIDWHTEDGNEDEPRTSLCFRESGEDSWTDDADADQHEVPYLDRTLHRVELTELEPDTEYVFQVGHFDREYRFRTMPEDVDDEPLTFAAGGDTQHAPNMFEITNEAAMEHDPQFVVWGGDLAYADGGDDPLHEGLWESWFDVVHDTLIDDDGRVVPIIAGIGNHEVVDGYYYEHDDYEQTDQWRQEHAPYYYTFFAFPGQPGYDVLDFGDYMSLVMLDSDHTNPVEGQQTEWLESVLADRADRDVSHVFPVYHVAAFPSHRDFDDGIQTRIRDQWVPLFEQHGVEVVFEKHDHTYKRTHPIREGEIDEDDGIVYLGDGAWGVITRDGESRDEWYIDEFASERHAIIFTIQGDEHHAQVVSEDREIIDEYGDPIDSQ